MFVPERVMTLIEPPEAPPDSAERPLVTTWNSCTISGDSSVRLDPVYSSLLSSPSTDTLLLRGRRPPNVKPLPVSGVEPLTADAAGELETPGAKRTKSRELRGLTRGSSILSASTAETTDGCDGSMAAGCAT